MYVCIYIYTYIYINIWGKAKTSPVGLVCHQLRQFMRVSPDKWVNDVSRPLLFRLGMAEFKCFWKFRAWTFLQIYLYFQTEEGRKDPWRKMFPLNYNEATKKFSLDKEHKFHEQCQGLSIFPYLHFFDFSLSFSFSLSLSYFFFFLFFSLLYYALSLLSLLFSLSLPSPPSLFSLAQLLASPSERKFVDLCLWTEVDFFVERISHESPAETERKLVYLEWFAFNIYYPTLVWPNKNGVAHQLCTFPAFLDEKAKAQEFSGIFTFENFYVLCTEK